MLPNVALLRFSLISLELHNLPKFSSYNILYPTTELKQIALG